MSISFHDAKLIGLANIWKTKKTISMNKLCAEKTMEQLAKLVSYIVESKLHNE